MAAFQSSLPSCPSISLPCYIVTQGSGSQGQAECFESHLLLSLACDSPRRTYILHCHKFSSGQSLLETERAVEGSDPGDEKAAV